MARNYNLTEEQRKRLEKQVKANEKRTEIRLQREKAAADAAFKENERDSLEARRREWQAESKKEADINARFEALVNRNPGAETSKNKPQGVGTVARGAAIVASRAPSSGYDPNRKSDYETLIELQGGKLPPIGREAMLGKNREMLGVTESEYGELEDRLGSVTHDIAIKEWARPIIEKAERDELLAYDLEAAQKRIDEAELASEMPSRREVLDVIKDGKNAREAFTPKSPERDKLNRAALLQSEELINSKGESEGVNKRESDFGSGAGFERLADAVAESGMRELIYKYAHPSPNDIVLGDYSKDLTLDEAALENTNAYSRLAQIEAFEKKLENLSLDGYTKAQINANIEFAKYRLIADYYEYIAANDPERKKYIELGKKNVEGLDTQNLALSILASENGEAVDPGTVIFSQAQDKAMAQQQSDTYYYLAGKNLNMMDVYKNSIERGLNEKVAHDRAVQLSKLVDESPIIGGVGGYIASSFKAPAAYLDMLASKAKGREYDPNSYLSSGTRDAETITAELLADIDSSVGKWWAELGLSTAQFMSHIPFGAAGLYMMGLEAAGSTAYSAYKNGATTDEALVLGFVAGLAETALEKIPFDKIRLAFKGGNEATRKSISEMVRKGMTSELKKTIAASGAKSIASAAGGEAFEEAASAYINTVANRIVLGERSDYAKFVNLLVEQGMSEEDAIREATLQYYIIEPLSNALSGAVSGGGMALGGATFNIPRNMAMISAAKKFQKASETANAPAAPVAPQPEAIPQPEQIPQPENDIPVIPKEDKIPVIPTAEDVPTIPEPVTIPEPEKVTEKAGDIPITTEYDDIPVIPEPVAEMRKPETEAIEPEALPTPETEAESRVPTVEDIKSDAEAGSVTEELMSDEEIQRILADFDALKTDNDPAVEPETETEPKIIPRDPNAEYFETGKLVPLTADEELRQAEASKAKNDTRRSGILAGASEADIAIAEAVSAVTGRKIIFESDAYDINGHFGENTVFVNPDRKSGDIASQVIAHELAHSTEDTKTYKALVDSLKSFVEANNYVDKDGVAHDWDYYVTDAHARYDIRYKELTGETFTDAKAESEAVAKVLQSFFADTAATGTGTQVALDKWLASYTKANRNAATRMWYSLAKTARRLKQDIAAKFKKGGNTPEVKRQREMLRKIEDIRDAFGRALIEAKKDAKKAAKKGTKDAKTKTLEGNGIGFDGDTKTAYSLAYSSLTNKDFNREELAEILADKTGRSIDDALAWIDGETSLAAIVMGHAEYLDYEADQRYEAIKTNSDYPQGTIDFSNLCPKREEFTAMFDILQKRYPNRTFTAEEIADMRNILKNHGVDVACGICYVEDRRQLLGEIADTFIGMWKTAVEGDGNVRKVNAKGESKQMHVTKYASITYGVTQGTPIKAKDTYIPTQYDLNTYEGFKKLSEEHPTIAMAFEVYNKSRGQQSGRYIEGHAEYKRQILKWSDATVKKVNANGGLRIFSFSDFQTIHMLDLVQIVIDCAARGVKIQGYTKVPALAKLLRGTGVKLNRSFVPAGETGIKTVDGKKVLDVDPVEGIDPNDRDFVNDPDDPDIGNIIIGINDEQIRLAMLDPNYDYIIPFHSNKSKNVLHKLDIGGWKNYKETQHDKGGKSKKDVNIYTDVIAKHDPKNKVEFVEAFLEECKAQGKTPRFAQFLDTDANGNYVYTEGYHKLLLDFKMFDSDGNILLQNEVSPNFDVNYMTKLALRDVRRQKDYKFNQEVYDELDAKYGDHGEAKSTKTAYSIPEGDDVGTMPVTERESMMRDRALEMYRKLDRGQNIGMPKEMTDPDEYIYSLTGWYRDELGNLIVHHEADVFQKERDANTRAAEQHAREATRLADQAVAQSTQTAIENVILREQLRDAQGKKSSDYTSSKKAAEKIIDEVTDVLGGGFTKKQKAELVKRYLEIYDEATEVNEAGRPAVSAEKIAARLGELVADMQDVRVEDADLFERAKAIKADLKTPVYLSEEARASIEGGYGKVAKQYRGKVNFSTKERGVPVSVRYAELSERYPSTFPSNITSEAAQAQKMIDAYNEIVEEWDGIDRYYYSGETARRSDANKAIKQLFEGIGEIYRIPKTVTDKYASYSEKVKRDADRRFEKERERIEANADKRVDQLAAIYSEATDQIAAEYRDAQKKMQEQAARSYWKNMTIRIYKRLEKLLNRPTKERNIKAGMQDVARSALSLINSIYNDKIPARELATLDYSYATEAERSNLDELRRLYEMRDSMDEGADTESIDGEIKKYENRLSELFNRKRSQMKEATVTSAIGDLYSKYGELESSTDDYIRDAYDETTKDILASIINDADLRGKKLRDLTPSELERVYGAIAAVVHAVYKANNLFGAQKAMEADAARTAVKDELYAGEAIKHDGKVPNALREYTNNLMRPDVFFNFLGSETLAKIAAESMRNGELIYAADVYAAQGKFAALKEKYHSDKWKSKKKREFHTEDGRKFKLSLDEMMSFYALWLRGKQAQDHIINGGIVLNSDGEKLFERVNEELDQKLKKGEKAKDAAEVIDRVTRSSGNAIRISDVLANKIIESLTDDQRGFVREGIKYLSEVMGAKGNEVFRELHGIDWFGEDSYFPIESDKNYLTRRIDEQNPNAAKLTSPSFVKSTVDEAKNPLIIRNFADVWARHVHDMSMYHAFAIPMANFNKVYGYARAGDAARGTENTSIRADIEKLRGKSAISYINDYISDINGGVHSDPRGRLWEKGLGNWKKAKVASSLSVIIQQPMSIIRAMGYLNAGTLTKRAVLRKPGRIRKQWREMMQYSGVTVLKDMGGFDMHSSRSTTDYIEDSKTVMQKADDIWMAGATVADKWAWCVMWNAAKDKAAKEMKKNGGFVKNSEAHLKRTAEIFDEVIYKTQVYDSVFAKSAFLRSGNPVVKMSMAFMGEPTTTFNMILDGYYDMRHGNKARGARKIVSAFASQIFAAAARSVIYAMRDDDEDESFLEKYVEHFIGGFADNVNPAGYLPWVKDVWSIFKGYDAKRSDMGLIEDLSKIVEKIAKNGSGAETITDLAMVVGDIFGIPASNIKREVMAAFNTAQMWARDIETTARGVSKAAEKGFWDSIPVVSWVRDRDSKSDELYKSILGEETDHVERLKSGYKDDASYETAVKTGLRENDERITDAAKLLLEGDVEGANKIVRIIAREGYFDKELVGDAVDSAYKAFENGIGNAASSFAEGDIEAAADYAEQLAEAGYDRELISDRINAAVEELINETPEDEDEAYTYYRASHIGTAFEHGHEDQIPAIVDELISVKIENDDSGDDPKDVEKEARSTVKSGVTRYLKPIYIEAYASGDAETMARVLNTLLATGLYGKSEGTVKRETLRSWEDAYDEEVKKNAKKNSSDDGIPVVHDEMPKFKF